MKTITIDFTKTPAEISDKILGHQGEHNRTKLIITPPAEMAENSDIKSYAVAFQVGAHKVAHSEICDKADTITVFVERKVSKTNVISLQLEGYDGKEDLLVLSERITDLVFEPSVIGEEYEGGDESALAEQVAALKEALNSRQTSTVSLEYNVDIMANETSTGVTLMLTAEGIIPNGAELKTIRFNREGQMIDIREMFKTDDIPYILNMSKVIISDIYALPIIAVISFFSEKNTIIAELLNYQIFVLEVEYYIQ